ncbi:MAG: thioredoxin [Anaerolineales bacterium]
MKKVTDDTFQSSLEESELPVLVDFGAEWCHPCKQLDPIVEELAGDWAEKVQVLHLDIDENANTTMQYGVMGVPTLILFVDGEPVERMTGFVPKAKIVDKLSQHLSAG